MIDPFLAALVNCPVFGCRSLERLFAYFPSAQAIWEAPEVDFINIDIPENRLAAFFTFRKQAHPEAYIELMDRHQIRLITKDDAEYPSLLKTIFDPPFVLFLKGAPLKELCVSMVGSRRNTEYGRKIATRFATELAQRNISIISGLAEGIDTASYKGALEGKGHTVAVLGGGLLKYNSRDKELAAQEILSNNGTVISEFPLQGSYASYHFPMRNRIIAGMSKITIIVEAALPSGSLTTAKAAIEAGRDVFAVPGPIDSVTSAGTNNLIKEGAFVATDSQDILLALEMSSPISKSTNTHTPIFIPKILPTLEPVPAKLYEHLEKGPLLADELTFKTGLSSPEVSCALLELELLGLVRHMGGTRYERT